MPPQGVKQESSSISVRPPPEEVAELELTEAKARQTVRKTTGSSVFAEKPCFRIIGPPQCGRGPARAGPDVFPREGDGA